MKLFSAPGLNAERKMGKKTPDKPLPVVPVLGDIFPARCSPGICDLICLEMMETANSMKARGDQDFYFSHLKAPDW